MKKQTAYRYKIALLLFVFSLMFGCAHIPAGLTPSTTPVNPDNITVLGHATGEVSYFSLLGIIPFGKPDYDKAIQNALSKFEGGKAMINVRSTFTYTFVVVGFINKLKVQGDVIK